MFQNCSVRVDHLSEICIQGYLNEDGNTILWDEDDITTLFALVVLETCLSRIFVLVCCAAAAWVVHCIMSKSSLSGLIKTKNLWVFYFKNKTQ